MSFGWSAGDVAQLVHMCWKVYRTFNDARDAPQHFRALANEFTAFHAVFTKLYDVLEKYNRPMHLAFNSIQLTIDKCLAFQKKFYILNDPTTSTSIGQRLSFGYHILTFTLTAQKVADRLRSELASHTRILTLYTSALNLETGFESRAINMETREHIRIIMGSRSPSGLPSIVEVPPMPQYLSQLREPEEPTTDEQLRSRSRAELEDARGELQALDHLLELEETKLAELQGSSTPGYGSARNADFIRLARQEVESEYERLSNYHKRKQNMPQHRSNTFDSGIADMSVGGSPSLDSDREMRLEASRTPRESATLVALRLAQKPGLDTASPEERNSISSNRSHLIRVRESPPERSGSLDSLTKTKEKYLERFERELAEIDQTDQLPSTSLPPPAIPISPDPAAMELGADAEQQLEIEDGILKTRRELFGLFERSFPPSPEINLSGQFSPTVTVQSQLPSSPPLSSSGGMRHRPSFPQSVRSGSVDLGVMGSWKWLAKDVAVTGVQYSCGQCKAACPTAMQFARRSNTGGFSFRIICTVSSSDNTPFRQDLSSSSPTLPHIFHSRADPSAATCVVVKGTNKRLDFYNRGIKCSLQLGAQPQYQFVSAEDCETFQQLLFGMRLVRRFDIRAVSSPVDSGSPSRFETLRIWQDIHSDKLVLMTHGALIKGLDPLIFYEEQSSFMSPSRLGERKLKLKTLEQNKPKAHIRRHSRDSGVSGLSLSSTESQGMGQKIKWLEIEFQDGKEREAFLTAWNGKSSGVNV